MGKQAGLIRWFWGYAGGMRRKLVGPGIHSNCIDVQCLGLSKTATSQQLYDTQLTFYYIMVTAKHPQTYVFSNLICRITAPSTCTVCYGRFTRPKCLKLSHNRSLQKLLVLEAIYALCDIVELIVIFLT